MTLNFELIPDSCWYSNLRTLLKPTMWDVLRKNAYLKANGRCMICSRPAKRLEAHERWQFDDKKKIQKLQEIIAICHDCHSVIHIGRTQLLGNENRAIKHYQKVNNCSYADYRKELGKANLLHQERNKFEWQLDITILNDIINSL